jgi:hypothetical protein
MRDIPYNEALDFVKTSLTKDNFPKMKDPLVTHTRRDEDGNQIKTKTKLTDYYFGAVSRNEFIAPTLTTYVNPAVKKSLLVDFIRFNKKARGVSKGAGFKAFVKMNTLTAELKNVVDPAKRREMEAEIDKYLLEYQVKDTEQEGAKVSNNSVSGAHVTPSNPLYCKSTHSTLTSITRLCSSTANSTNEKLVYGNRYYPSYASVIEAITSLITVVDLNELEKLMRYYQLYYPTVEDVISVITYSTSLYWKNMQLTGMIREYLYKLQPIELAAFVYIGDMYHLRRFNDGFVRTMFEDILEIVVKPGDYTESMIHEYDEGLVNLAQSICSDYTKGYGKDFDKMLANGVFNTLIPTIENIVKKLSSYEALLLTLFLNKNGVMRVSEVPDMVRRSVVVSDTDSTIFSLDTWGEWFSGGTVINDRFNRAVFLGVYIASQSVRHALAIMSSNFGADGDRLRELAMKPEFYFPVFTTANATKTYYSSIAIREGNVYSTPKAEIKGTHLKPSNSTKEIVKDAEKMMISIMDDVLSTGTITIKKYLTWTINQEKRVVHELESGDTNYFKFTKIKGASAYKNDNSPYLRHLFWEEVFAPKYGTAGAPPYTCIKVSLSISNKTELTAWLDSIQDIALRERAKSYFLRTGRKDFTTLYLPHDVLLSKERIPEELVPVMNISKIVYNLMQSHYLILGSIGLELNNKGYLLKDQLMIN